MLRSSVQPFPRVVLGLLLLGPVSPAAAAAEWLVPQPLPSLTPAQAQPPEPVPPQTPVADLLSGIAAPLWPPTAGGVAAAPPSLAYPLPDPADEVDPYGWRWSDSRQAWRMHAGQDLIAPEGTPVLAMAPGRVVLVEEVDGYGLTVMLEHRAGWQSLYAHLRESAVQEGDELRAGDPLGRVGRSGRASTDHLHVEVRRRLPAGATATGLVVAVDPSQLLNKALQRLPLQQARGMTRTLP